MYWPKRALATVLLAVAAVAIPITASAVELPGSGTLTWSVPFSGR